MSNQGKAYRLTDEQRGALWVHADSLGRRFPNEAPEQVFWQETAAAISHPVPTAQDMYNEVMRRYDALPTQWGYALIYCWRQVASEWGLAGFQSPKEVAYAESYERLHLTKPLEFEGDFGCRE